MPEDRKLINYTLEEILREDPLSLAKKIEKEYMQPIPDTLNDVESMKKASTLLSKLINLYSYFSQLSQYAKIDLRQKKRNKLDKTIVEDAIDRKDVISNTADIFKMQYNALSRMVTVKKEINNELRMSDSVSN